jgi:CRISPR/Cas system-associated exonuclease Cas4 (RecB family)
MKNYLTVSASSLSTFFKCSQQYKWSYIDELEPDEGTASLYAVFGSTFHKLVELHYKFNIDTSEIKACWKTMFLSFCTETKALDIPNKHELQKFIDRGYEYIDSFTKMKSRWVDYKVLDVEKYYRIPFENSFIKNTFLSGRIDLLLDKQRKEIVCLDWKTSKSKEKDVENNIQLTFYSYFVNFVYKLSFESIYAGLVYPYDMDILFAQRTQEDVDRLFVKINVMLERISKSDFSKEPKIRCTPDDCFFCQYTKTCKK